MENKIQIVFNLFKIIFEIIFLIFYGIYSCTNLLFRKLIPRPVKSLDEEIFLITGAASGIGKEVVLYLAKNHPRTKLVLWDWNEAENRETAEKAKLLGVQAWSYQVDVTDRRQVDETAKKVLDQVGKVSILFNNAGVTTLEEVLSAPPEKIERTIAINLVSHFWTIKAFVPGMIEADHGHIVTTCSVGGFFGLRCDAPYSASKYGIRGYLEGFKSELRHHPLQPKINFTTIFPYFVHTPLTTRITECKFNMAPVYLDAKYVAKKIIQGVCRNEENIFLPGYIEIVTFFKSFLPSDLLNKIEDFVLQELVIAKE